MESILTVVYRTVRVPNVVVFEKALEFRAIRNEQTWKSKSSEKTWFISDIQKEKDHP